MTKKHFKAIEDTMENTKALKVKTSENAVVFVIGNEWYKIPMNGKIHKTRITEIVKTYGAVMLEIENNEIYGKRVVNVIQAVV